MHKRVSWFLAMMLGLLLTPFGPPIAAAYERPIPAQLPPEQVPVFRLPFDIPPGASTWYVIQFYGNTQSAYRRRTIWYGAGQGVHFGLDLAAKCGTPVVAIGDGTVIKVDAAEHGAGPHNLVILHDNGYASLYGHLNERPPFARFTEVKAGDFVGVTGDPDLTCSSRPHLHLEIRSDDLYRAYNPIPLIAADWDSLALFGPLSSFQRDLENPRRWMTPGDQPEVIFGTALLNEYDQPWPPDWRN